MKLLKKENWWIWLMLAFFSGSTSFLVLAALLDVYDKEAWYFRWIKKIPKKLALGFGIVIGVFTLITSFAFPFALEFDLGMISGVLGILILFFSLFYTIIMLLVMVFQIQILTQLNAKLKTPGSEIYLSPYVWLLCLIIPIIGWICLIVMYLYLQIWYLVMLYRGEGENIERK